MSLKKFSFKITHNDNESRSGLIETQRGNIETPVFMPVGTQATVKAVFINDIIKTGSKKTARKNGPIKIGSKIVCLLFLKLEF